MTFSITCLCLCIDQADFHARAHPKYVIRPALVTATSSETLTANIDYHNEVNQDPYKMLDYSDIKSR